MSEQEMSLEEKLKEEARLKDLIKFEEYLASYKPTPEEIAEKEKYRREMAPFWAAEKKYLEAGLGPTMHTFWDYAPPAAKKYPGGPVAVYEEAVKRGVTWEEVCGYTPPPYYHGFID